MELKMKNLYRVSTLFLLFITNNLYAEYPIPKQVMDNVRQMSETVALIDVCILSSEYKNLSKNNAIQLKNLRGRFEKVIDNIAIHYKDKDLFRTFTNLHFKAAIRPDVIKFSKKKYKLCGGNLYTDVSDWINSSERSSNKFFSETK